MSAIGLIAFLCIFTMGFAIQRGGTCTVAAVDEVMTNRRARRLLAMLEASLWVAGSLALARLAGLAGSMPASFPVGAWTFVGGALLGLGAWLNRACVFGAVARLGSGEWAYVLTPAGFYVGCLSVTTIFPRPAVDALAGAPSPLGAAVVLGPLFVACALWRLRPGLLAVRSRGGATGLRRAVWTPHAATIVIGLTFVVTLLLAGRWAYTDVLADLAQRMHGAPTLPGLPLLLLLALYAGALAGGRSGGRWRSASVSAPQFARCFGGGLVMAWGSLLIPGSNDGLILIGIPLLHPYAWLAFASMCIAIAGAMLAQRAFANRAPVVPAPPPARRERDTA